MSISKHLWKWSFSMDTAPTWQDVLFWMSQAAGKSTSSVSLSSSNTSSLESSSQSLSLLMPSSSSDTSLLVKEYWFVVINNSGGRGGGSIRSLIFCHGAFCDMCGVLDEVPSYGLPHNLHNKSQCGSGIAKFENSQYSNFAYVYLILHSLNSNNIGAFLNSAASNIRNFHI